MNVICRFHFTYHFSQQEQKKKRKKKRKKKFELCGPIYHKFLKCRPQTSAFTTIRYAWPQTHKNRVFVFVFRVIRCADEIDKYKYLICPWLTLMCKHTYRRTEIVIALSTFNWKFGKLATTTHAHKWWTNRPKWMFASFQITFFRMWFDISCVICEHRNDYFGQKLCWNVRISLLGFFSKN